MHGKTPELAAPQRTNGSIPSIFGGEIGTGMRIVPSEFVTRSGASPPTSPSCRSCCGERDAQLFRIGAAIKRPPCCVRRPAPVPSSNLAFPVRPSSRRPAGAGFTRSSTTVSASLAQRADGRVRLLTRKGTNLSNRFPQIVAAVILLPVRSCLIDGEAVVCDDTGLAVFDMIRGYRHDTSAVLCAFDLLEVDGKDLRRTPIEERKGTRAKLLSHPHEGIAFNQHYDGDGAMIFKHACALGCEGIVSKRLGSAYRSGRVDHWLKVKNPAAPAVRREAEEDWSGKRNGR